MKKKQKYILSFILLFFLLLDAVLFNNPALFLIEEHLEMMWISIFDTMKPDLEAPEDIVVINLEQDRDKYEILYGKDFLNDSSDRLHYQTYESLFADRFSQASAVFILDDLDVEYSRLQKEYVQLFRSQGNVFWHRTENNANSLNSKDNCGYISYEDSYRIFDESRDTVEGAISSIRSFCFYEDFRSVSDSEEAVKIFFPYYYYSMSGYEVKNDMDNQRVILTAPDGEKKYIPVNSSGYITRRNASQCNIKEYSLFEARQISREEFKNKKIFITSGYAYDSLVNADRQPQNLASYYIDSIATVDNDACIAYPDKEGSLLIFLITALILGFATIFLSSFGSIMVYIIVEVGYLVLHIVLLKGDIFFLPLLSVVLFNTLLVIFLHILVIGVKIREARAMPMDAIVQFTTSLFEMAEFSDYKQYLREHKKEIERALSIRILHADEPESGELFTSLMEESKRSRRAILGFKNKGGGKNGLLQIRTKRFPSVRYAIFVPLPVFDKELEEQNYTVLGSRHRMKKQFTRYVSTLILSIYIYFKAQNESGRRQEMYFSMLKLLVSVIDAKDPITAGHSQRVADYSADLGRWLELDKKTQMDLEFAALLHDIGKVSVSDYVLNKPSLFTRNDFEQMKHHTVRGAEILSAVGLSEDIIAGVRHHHERMDGKGYPDNLSGEQLNLFAKIIKIADVYDALTSRRQYKEAWENTKALNIIYNGMGTEFDAYIANVFIQHMKPEGWVPPVQQKPAPATVLDDFMEKSNRILEDLYRNYHNCISVEFPMHTRKSDYVDFNADYGFMGYDWGETFNNPLFLANRPMILSYEEDTQSIFLGQRCHSDGVENIYYYYFKGFIHLGIYLLDYTSVDYIKDMLREHFGEPVSIDERTQCYKGNKYRLICKRTKDDKNLLCYVSEYLCSNYVFHKLPV